MPSIEYQYDEMMNPALQALRALGGSGRNEEINQQVAEIMKIPAETLEVLHNPEKGGMTELEYRLMWTRTYLKKYGLIENSARGVWALTPQGQALEKVDPKQVVKKVREMIQAEQPAGQEPQELQEPDKILAWQEQLLDVILNMSPGAFERLVQRILREAGFVQVQVTGRSGDGGVDGHGIMRLGGLLSFNVIFQAKKWKGYR